MAARSTSSHVTGVATSRSSTPRSEYENVAIGLYLFGFAVAVLLLATLSTLGRPLISALEAGGSPAGARSPPA